MNTSTPFPFSLPEAAPELARRFCMILGGLAVLVARRFVRMPHLVGITALLWNRLSRAVPRFVRALGKAAKPRAARKPAARADRVRAPSLPSGRGWLLRELGWEAAAYTNQMEALLAEPGMPEALAASPGLARILRPICRMLGVSGTLTPKTVPAAATPPMGSAVSVKPSTAELTAPADVPVDDGVRGVGVNLFPAYTKRRRC